MSDSRKFLLVGIVVLIGGFAVGIAIDISRGSSDIALHARFVVRASR